MLDELGAAWLKSESFSKVMLSGVMMSNSVSTTAFRKLESVARTFTFSLFSPASNLQMVCDKELTLPFPGDTIDHCTCAFEGVSTSSKTSSPIAIFFRARLAGCRAIVSVIIFTGVCYFLFSEKVTSRRNCFRSLSHKHSNRSIRLHVLEITSPSWQYKFKPQRPRISLGFAFHTPRLPGDAVIILLFGAGTAVILTDWPPAMAINLIPSPPFCPDDAPQKLSLQDQSREIWSGWGN